MARRWPYLRNVVVEERNAGIREKDSASWTVDPVGCVEWSNTCEMLRMACSILDPINSASILFDAATTASRRAD